MDFRQKYQLLPDHLKTVHIKDVLKGIPLSSEQMKKWEEHVKIYGPVEPMHMPAMKLDEI